MRSTLMVLAGAAGVLATADSQFNRDTAPQGYVTQIGDGQIQAPTGYAPPPPAYGSSSTVVAPVPSSSAPAPAPPAYSSSSVEAPVPSSSAPAPPVYSSSSSVVAPVPSSSAPAPAPPAYSSSAPVAPVPSSSSPAAPAYTPAPVPAGNSTGPKPTGSYGTATLSTSKAAGGATGAPSASAPPNISPNGAGALQVSLSGALLAGLVAFFA